MKKEKIKYKDLQDDYKKIIQHYESLFIKNIKHSTDAVNIYESPVLMTNIKSILFDVYNKTQKTYIILYKQDNEYLISGYCKNFSKIESILKETYNFKGKIQDHFIQGKISCLKDIEELKIIFL